MTLSAIRQKKKIFEENKNKQFSFQNAFFKSHLISKHSNQRTFYKETDIQIIAILAICPIIKKILSLSCLFLLIFLSLLLVHLTCMSAEPIYYLLCCMIINQKRKVLSLFPFVITQPNQFNHYQEENTSKQLKAL